MSLFFDKPLAPGPRSPSLRGPSPSLLPGPMFLQPVGSSQHDGAACLCYHPHTSSTATSLKHTPTTSIHSAQSTVSLPPHPRPLLSLPALTCLLTNSFHQRNVFLAFLQKLFGHSFIHPTNIYLELTASLASNIALDTGVDIKTRC